MANPDIADIIVVYLKEVYPDALVVKASREILGPDIFVIEVNGNYVGVTVEDVFATWNFIDHDSIIVKASNPKFFETVLFWARLKAKLGKPTLSLS